jgi:phosphatidylserine/phosphatidylglycerophosphate/cardiolipin synthase-like enzyme
MRSAPSNGPLRVKVFAGTYVVLMAMDLDAAAQPGLRGFAIKRGSQGAAPHWLEGTKFFESLVPAPVRGAMYSSRHHPFQTFLWSDYTAKPDTTYDFTVVALYGTDLHALDEKYPVHFQIKTEKDDDGKHGIWFNRGVLASHALATQFHNKKLTDAMTENVSAAGVLLDAETAWLSRGLAEACLKYINDTKAGEGLRVCAYEFTYQPVLLALGRAKARGVDVKIIYHDTAANNKAVAKAALPASIVTLRTRPPIPHNKFIVKLEAGVPRRVWTGSTNFTDTGFLGQVNVGHLVTDDATAGIYLKYWKGLKLNPTGKPARLSAMALTPNPSNALTPKSITPFFSPRDKESMLDWYGGRIGITAGLAMMTLPFNVATQILGALSKPREAMRLVILEDVPSDAVKAAERANKGKLAFSNGAIIGKSFVKYKRAVGGAKVAPIPHSDLDKWFIEEEFPRPTTSGHVFFVHSKILIVDPLSSDPLVCSGSANFSKNSLVVNDENMLLIRGETRVADIYVTELDRIFRHFRARDVLNRTAKAGGPNPLALDTTDGWIGWNFKPGTYRNNRRLLFFPGPGVISDWVTLATADPAVFGPPKAKKKTKKKAKRAKTKRVAR